MEFEKSKCNLWESGQTGRKPRSKGLPTCFPCVRYRAQLTKKKTIMGQALESMVHGNDPANLPSKPSNEPLNCAVCNKTLGPARYLALYSCLTEGSITVYCVPNPQICTMDVFNVTSTSRNLKFDCRNCSTRVASSITVGSKRGLYYHFLSLLPSSFRVSFSIFLSHSCHLVRNSLFL